MWRGSLTESYVFAACAREVAWTRLVDEAPLTASDIDDSLERQRGVDPAMSTLTVKSGPLRCFCAMRMWVSSTGAGASLQVVIPWGLLAW